MTYKLYEIDNGFCRIYYRNTETKALLCFQENGYGSQISFEFLVCSRDGEPSHEVKIPDNLPVPDGDSTVERNFRKWLEMEQRQCHIIA